MKRSVFLVLFLFTAGGSSFALSSFPPDMLAHKSFAQRYFYIDLIVHKFIPAEDSSKYFSRTEEIRQLGIKLGDAGLETEAEMLKLAYYTKKLNNNNSRCISLLNKMQEKARKDKNEILLARVNNLAGAYYWEVMKNYELGFEYYLAEYKLIKNMSVEEYPGKQQSIYILGNCYYYFHDYPMAIQFLTEAFKTDIFGESLYFTLQATNSVGLCYQHLGNLDSADHYFLRANSVAVTVGNEAWDGITSGNLGNNYFLRGKYSEAIPLLTKDLELSVHRADWGCASGSLMVLAEINLAQGNSGLAEKQADQAREWIRLSGQYSRLKSLYPLLGKIEDKKGKAEMANAYRDSAVFVKDSLEKQFASLKQLLSAQKAERDVQREAEASSERFREIMVNTVTIIGISILAFVLMWFLWQLKGKKNFQFR